MSEQEIQVFNFNDKNIRIVDRDGNLWFVAKDVCKALDLKNPRQAVKTLDSDEKDSVQDMDAIGRLRKTRIISESGLYYLMNNSRKDPAKRFSKWVRSVVIPSIRKKGFYSTNPTGTSAEVLLAVAEGVAASAKELVEHEKQLKDHEDRISMIEEQQRDAADALMDVEFADEEPEEKTLRAKVNQLVRAYCLSTGTDFQDAWNKIYTDFKYRYHIDLRQRAKNREMSPIDLADQLGGMSELFKVASKICRDQDIVPTPARRKKSR